MAEEQIKKGCTACRLFGCEKAFDDKNECDIWGKPTPERCQTIASSGKYKVKIDKYRAEEECLQLNYFEEVADVKVKSVGLRRRSSRARIETRYQKESRIETREELK